jgi:hypothetical protein
VRVRFAVAPEATVSLVAAREDGRLAPFRAPASGSVALAAYGDVPSEAMLGEAARADWRDAWAVRGFGTLVMVLAALFATPALAERLGGDRASGGAGRRGTALLFGVGLAAAVCAASWLGARLLLQAGTVF